MYMAATTCVEKNKLSSPWYGWGYGCGIICSSSIVPIKILSV